MDLLNKLKIMFFPKSSKAEEAVDLILGVYDAMAKDCLSILSEYDDLVSQNQRIEMRKRMIKYRNMIKDPELNKPLKTEGQQVFLFLYPDSQEGDTQNGTIENNADGGSNQDSEAPGESSSSDSADSSISTMADSDTAK